VPVDTVVDATRAELLIQLDDHGEVELLHWPGRNQLMVQVRRAEPLRKLAVHLRARQFHLVTMVANDERELEDRSFKIYYLFSHPETDLLLMVEYLLGRGADYPSLYEEFESVDCFEREIRDLFGLVPQQPREAEVKPGSWLHEPYPDGLFPLRRDRSTTDLEREVAAWRQDGGNRPSSASTAAPADAGLLLPVGPVHAGIIEPGRFLFTIAGEAIENLDIGLGYTHKGIERLFQAGVHLLDGWMLAEQVSGDSSFAHGLAYCRAVERLTETQAPPAAELLRGVFLELERIHNHVADVAALAEDVALERLSSDLSIVREELLRLNKRVAGHRYLRRRCRPGGMVLPAPFDGRHVRRTLGACVDRFDEVARHLAGRPGFRDRTIGVGVLTQGQARRLGVTGLAARASGIPRDYRCDHPAGVYEQAWLDAEAHLRAGPSREPQAAEAQAGDVYARFLTRVLEVRSSHAVIGAILDQCEELPPTEREHLLDEPRVLPENNYTVAIGYAEGFRGDIVYWLMQDKLDGVYRCKVRDPSMLNWPGLRQSVVPWDPEGPRPETVLADFPLVNKSFNLSYSGNDL
jgi:Ni,Fe-hydrogenase III large subunit/Ni,Fe-hydrogenase III component G